MMTLIKSVKSIRSPFIAHSEQHSFYASGSLAEVSRLAKQALDISEDEISLAVTWMTENGHDVAHFGVNGKVTCTSLQIQPNLAQRLYAKGA